MPKVRVSMSSEPAAYTCKDTLFQLAVRQSTSTPFPPFPPSQALHTALQLRKEPVTGKQVSAHRSSHCTIFLLTVTHGMPMSPSSSRTSSLCCFVTLTCLLAS